MQTSPSSLRTVRSSHHPEWRKGAGAPRQHTSEARAVAQNDARHPIVIDPVEAERRVHFRAIVHREEAVALQPPRGHQNEYAKRRIAEAEADGWRLGE